jgi:hypothetical protein
MHIPSETDRGACAHNFSELGSPCYLGGSRVNFSQPKCKNDSVLRMIGTMFCADLSQGV